jgi:hypothetical protein
MMALFRDIQTRKLSVRDVEKLTREIAWDRARKRDVKPEIQAMEKELAESLGTAVEIREEAAGGKLIINYFSSEDLEAILLKIRHTESAQAPVAPLSKDLEDDFSVENFSI